MTEQQAKEILLRYRPGVPDESDPELVEALELARQRPDLWQWLTQQQLANDQIRSALRGIRVPEGLKQQILSERKAANAGFWPKRGKAAALASAMALIVLFLAGYAWWGQLHRRDDLSFDSFRIRMVGNALRSYTMDMETNSLPAVRSYLAQHDADADWNLTSGLDAVVVTGCGVLRWQNNPVTMVCFATGRPLAEGQKSDAYLFVIDQEAPHNPPATGIPQIVSRDRVATASWSVGGRTYLLAVEGDETTLRKLL